MKASKVRRQATLCVANQYFLHEAVWMRGRLLLDQLPRDEGRVDDPGISGTSL